MANLELALRGESAVYESMQTTLGRLPCLQYDFASKWLSEIKPLLELPEVASEFQRRFNDHVALLESLRDDGAFGEGDAGQKLCLSQVLEAETRLHDLHWLRECLSSYDLACLSLVIAEALRPGEGWDILEGRETEHCVVSNRLRTLVFDMKLSDKLSGAESLIYAGESPDLSSPTDGARLREHLARKTEKHEQALRNMQELLASNPETP